MCTKVLVGACDSFAGGINTASSSSSRGLALRLQRARLLPLIKKADLQALELDVLAISRDLEAAGGGSPRSRQLQERARSIGEIERDSQRAAAQISSAVGDRVEVGICGRQLTPRAELAIWSWLHDSSPPRDHSSSDLERSPRGNSDEWLLLSPRDYSDIKSRCSAAFRSLDDAARIGKNDADIWQGTELEQVACSPLFPKIGRSLSRLCAMLSFLIWQVLNKLFFSPPRHPSPPPSTLLLRSLRVLI